MRDLMIRSNGTKFKYYKKNISSIVCVIVAANRINYNNLNWNSVTILSCDLTLCAILANLILKQAL